MIASTDLPDGAPAPTAAREVSAAGSGHGLDDLHECRDCGLVQTLPRLEVGNKAECLRCHATLRRQKPNPINRALFCTLAAAVLFAFSLSEPLLDMSVIGQRHVATLFTGPAQLRVFGMWEISLAVLTVLVAMPILKMLLMLTVLIGVKVRPVHAWLPAIFGWLQRIGPWAMVEVFLLGVFVAYTRLVAIAQVEIGPALIALGGVMVAMSAADAAMDNEAVWEEMERHGLRGRPRDMRRARLIGCETCGMLSRSDEGLSCPRCRQRLWARKPDAVVRTWLLVATAALLYIPANLLPVMTVIRFGRGAPSTIASGVVELAAAQDWPLALLVLFASILVPCFKLIALSTMLIVSHSRSGWQVRRLTSIYRVVEFIGRWSMIDVFMVTILVGLVRVGIIASVMPGLGAVAFAAVVVLTMFAASSFDPRLMWDRAGLNGGAFGSSADDEVRARDEAAQAHARVPPGRQAA